MNDRNDLLKELQESHEWHEHQRDCEVKKALDHIASGDFTVAIRSLVWAARHQEASRELLMHLEGK